MRNFSKYIGLDYETHDCFAIVRDFYKDEYGVELLNYFDGQTRPDKQTSENLIKTNEGDFEKIEKEEFGAIVVINLYGYACHIGVCLGDGKFLHSIRKIGSCIEPLSKYQRMIEGFYKHKGKQP